MLYHFMVTKCLPNTNEKKCWQNLVHILNNSPWNISLSETDWLCQILTISSFSETKILTMVILSVTLSTRAWTKTSKGKLILTIRFTLIDFIFLSLHSRFLWKLFSSNLTLSWNLNFRWKWLQSQLLKLNNETKTNL